MHRIVNDQALDTLFRTARDHCAWLAQPIGDTVLRAVWELVELAPVRTRTPPARVAFVRSDDVKARLAAALPESMRSGVAAAPVVAVIGFPAERNHPTGGSLDPGLHAAYLILAARALGLDCHPVWDFDRAAVAATAFPDDAVAVNFVCALGYGDEARLPPNEGRPGRGEACRIL